MISRYYLFCNMHYGLSYLRVFSQFAIDHPKNEYVIVFSKRNLHSDTLNVLDRIRSLFRFAEFKLRINMIVCGNCEIVLSESINTSDFVNAVPLHSIGFVAGFNQIFKQSLIDRFDRLINFHPSILPYYRGAIPSYWALKNNEKQTGFTAHEVIEEIDSGPIIYQEVVNINPTISEENLDSKIAAVGSAYLRESLHAITNNKQLRINYESPPYVNLVDYYPAKREKS